MRIVYNLIPNKVTNNSNIITTINFLKGRLDKIDLQMG